MTDEAYVLILGDIVGRPGRSLVREFVPQFRNKGVQFVVANAENAAGGSGLTRDTACELFDSGVDVITTGDHAFRNREILDIIGEEPRILRPANFSPHCPGHGSVMVNTNIGRFVVINLIGRVFMSPSECPFTAAEREMMAYPQDSSAIVDFHAEATSEKVAFGRFFDGRAVAIVGTHTHIQTADETVTPNGTAYITDCGMTGPYDSVIGRDGDAVINSFITGMPGRFEVASGDPRLCGVLVKISKSEHKALGIRRIQLSPNSSFNVEF